MLRKIEDLLYATLLLLSIAFGMKESNFQHISLVLACIIRLYSWIPVNSMKIESNNLYLIYKNLNKQYFSIIGLIFFEIFRTIKRRNDIDKEVQSAKNNHRAFSSYFKPLEIFGILTILFIITPQNHNNLERNLSNLYNSVLAIITMQIITIFINSLYCKVILDKSD